MFDTVLFDLDGTLMETSEGIIKGVAYALERLALPPLDAAVARRFIGPPLSESFCRYVGLPPEKADKAVRLFYEYYQSKGVYECRPYPTIPQMLETLNARGCRLMVATSKLTGFAGSIMERFGLASQFSDIMGREPAENRNTKTDVIRSLLEKHALHDLDTVVLVGDTTHDQDGAAVCGIHMISVTYGYGSADELLAGPHDILLHTPEEVMSYILAH